MNALIIEEKYSKFAKISNTILSIIFIALCVFIALRESAIETYGILFFGAAFCGVAHLVKLLYNTVWKSDRLLLKINNTDITSKVSGSKFDEEWVQVSKVTIGVSYIIFFIDGGRKQRKLDLSQLFYNDVGNVKSKVIELCEYKNIPYLND